MSGLMAASQAAANEVSFHYCLINIYITESILRYFHVITPVYLAFLICILFLWFLLGLLLSILNLLEHLLCSLFTVRV